MMKQLQVRVVSEGGDQFLWMVVDHLWDSISAPISLSPTGYPTQKEAMVAGVAELRRIEATPARDHPLKD